MSIKSMIAGIGTVPPDEAARMRLLTQILMAGGLLFTIQMGLLSALLAGLLVYLLVEFGSRMLEGVGLHRGTAKVFLLVFVGVIVITALAVSVSVFATHLTDGPESIVVLLQKMADVVDKARIYLPTWAQHYLPANINEWQDAASTWLRDNASHISVVGRDVGVILFHIIAGMLIGGMVAINPGLDQSTAPLSAALRQRVGHLTSAFRRIVFSQIRISALNTVLTGIFLAIVLPLMGSPLPLVKTMIAVTFMVGLLPIVGNLISNTMIVLIGLSVSPAAAAGALVFLIVIHKLEYFINARIIGTRIRAKAWEILMAMLVMDAAFGMAGLIAAPIYYAYLKNELTAQKLI